MAVHPAGAATVVAPAAFARVWLASAAAATLWIGGHPDHVQHEAHTQSTRFLGYVFRNFAGGSSELTDPSELR